MNPENEKYGMMMHEGFTTQHRKVGIIAAWAVFILGITYLPVTVLGLLSLKSPAQPIGDPYFTIMELLIVIMAPFMVAAMVAVHAYAPAEAKVYSLIALAFMILLAGITSSVHSVILTVSRQVEAAGPPWLSMFFSFTWPSVLYTLDILAWDWFLALSMLCAAPVFQHGRLETGVRALMIATGIISLAGLIGVPLGNMNVRDIGIIGYALVQPFAFLVLALLFQRAEPHY